MAAFAWGNFKLVIFFYGWLAVVSFLEVGKCISRQNHAWARLEAREQVGESLMENIIQACEN